MAHAALTVLRLGPEYAGAIAHTASMPLGHLRDAVARGAAELERKMPWPRWSEVFGDRTVAFVDDPEIQLIEAPHSELAAVAQSAGRDVDETELTSSLKHVGFYSVGRAGGPFTIQDLQAALQSGQPVLFVTLTRETLPASTVDLTALSESELGDRTFVQVGEADGLAVVLAGAIAGWWAREGKSRFPSASTLAIVECGESRSRDTWRPALGDLAAATGLAIALPALGPAFVRLSAPPKFRGLAVQWGKDAHAYRAQLFVPLDEGAPLERPDALPSATDLVVEDEAAFLRVSIAE